MSGAYMLAVIIVAVVAMILAISKLKIHPFIVMTVIAIAVGLLCGMNMEDVINKVKAGFGNILASIGIVILAGTIIGTILEKTGAALTMANTILKLVGKERSVLTMGLTGYVTGIPVFCDSGFVILSPISRALAAQSNKSLAVMATALSAGLYATHCLVPPTPGPITCAAIMNISLGSMILFGILIGLPAFFISVFLYQKLVLRKKNYWDPVTDEMHDPVKEAEAKKRADSLMRNPEKLPSLFESLFPILLPIVLILLNTVWRAVVGVDAKGVSRVPQFIQLIGGREVAMLLGLFAAMCICRRKDRMSRDQIADSITSAIGSCGTVLLITGLGGSFGAVLQATGVGTILQSMLESVHIPVILFVWMLAAVLKFAQGSGTVAMITALEIAAAMTITVNPVLIALAGMSGSLMGAHVNDSGFWVTANIAGLTTKGGLKIYTVICAIMSLVSLSLILLLRIFI